MHSTFVEAQGLKFEPVTKIASTDTGLIEGKVTDELGAPLDGAVISALGGTTATPRNVSGCRANCASSKRLSVSMKLVCTSTPCVTPTGAATACQAASGAA